MKTHRVCKKCNGIVVKETRVKGYPFYCQNCDENMYKFETTTIRALKKNGNINKNPKNIKKCFIKFISPLHRK